MIADRRPDEFAPLTWFGRVPVYAAGMLVIVHTTTMVLAVLAGPLGLESLVAACVFSTSGVLDQFRFWQIFTYAFVPYMGGGWWAFMFLIQMAMLWFFGSEVEKFLGRRTFLIAYGLLLLLPPLLLTVAGIFGVSAVLVGAFSLHFAVFICFVAINPGAQIFFGIAAKWIAAILLAINTLQLISMNAWTQLFILWIQCAGALVIMYYCGVRGVRALWPERPIERRPMRQRPSRPKSTRREKPANPVETIDPILEKIARNGIGSLTPRERALLEKAREELLHRDGKG